MAKKNKKKVVEEETLKNLPQASKLFNTPVLTPEDSETSGVSLGLGNVL